ARRARVADGQVAIRRDLQLRKGVALLQPGHAHAARTMFIQVPTHTVAPSWFSETDSNTKNPLPARSEMSLTVTVVVISSPATTVETGTASFRSGAPGFCQRARRVAAARASTATAVSAIFTRPSLRHLEAEHHAALVVLGDVAVRHPQSGVGDVEQDVDGLAGAAEHR